MTPDIYKRLSRYLTLFGDGKINLNTASDSVLRAVGLEAAVAEFISSYRVGIDRAIGTRDDGVFYTTFQLVEAAESHGAVSGDSKSNLEDLLSRGLFKVTSDFYEVQSTASRKEGQELLTARTIIGREHGIQSWKEVSTRNA
jgi:type II secretory pathway component PulK